MEKDFEKLLEDLNKVVDGMGDLMKEFEKDVKKATGKTLDEIIAMPVNTPEERQAFVDELMKVRKMMTGEKKCNFKGQYIKITGGESCTSFEASGNSVDLFHMLAQGVATVLSRQNLDEKDTDEFLKLFSDEIKEMIKKMEII